MAPPGRWGIRGSSLPAFGVSGERLKSRHLSSLIRRRMLSVSLLGGAADIEETFDPARSLDGRLRTSVSAADRFGCTSGAS